MKHTILLLFLLTYLAGFAQPDSSKKEMKKIPENVIQEGKKIFFDRNKTPQKILEESKINQMKKGADILYQAPQKAKDFLQLEQDTKESLLKARLVIEVDETEENETPGNKKRLKGPDQFDSRIELRQLDPLIDWQLQILRNAGSVGLVVRKELLVPITDSIFRLGINQTLEEKYNLCPGQAFGKQPVIGDGTAFIINDTSLMTAAHVLEDAIDKYAVIFGYELVNKIGSYETDIPVINIFYPTSIAFKDDNLDIAVFTIHRETGRLALPLSDRQVQLADQVYTIGYPSGLPQKVSVNARVRTNDQLQYFFTSLDAFQGNSGSPVFDLHTHEVTGILVSGELDYRFNGRCNEVTICKMPYCQGEKVIRITAVKKAMN